MTAQPAAATRTVTLVRADHPGWWPTGYFDALVGCGVRIPAGVIDGRVVAGYLLAVSETEDTIALTFGELAPEGD